MSKSLLLSSFVAAAAAIAGCLDALPPEESEVAAAVGMASPASAAPEVEPWDPEQGRRILGAYADALTAPVYFRVAAAPIGRAGFQLSVNEPGPDGSGGTHLVARSGSTTRAGADPWFIGMELGDGAGRRLRITSVAPLVASGATSTLYFLEYRAGSNAPWIDYCAGAGGAIALAGFYDHDRIHRPGAWISFACADSAGHKCVRWGYHPGAGGPGVSSWDHHQACTAMANADYCRNGKSYTLEGTPIRIRDFSPASAYPSPVDIVHPDKLPGAPDQFYFEAAWRPGSLTPICLSKLRWAMMAPDACAGALEPIHDPRYSTAGQFCDDITLETLQSTGGLLVSGSMMMDAELHAWRNPATGDVVTTVRSYVLGTDGGVAWHPFPGYTEYLGSNGVILRNPPSSIALGPLIPLYRQRHPGTGDRVVATAVALPGYTLEEFEGYAFDSQPTQGESRPLRLCRIGTDYRTTISPPPGCQIVATLGWAMTSP